MYMVQDGFSTESASIPLRCDGTVIRSVVFIPMADVPLHPGPATANSCALVMDPDTGDTADDSPTMDIIILP
jgi:hypothetical protein